MGARDAFEVLEGLLKEVALTRSQHDRLHEAVNKGAYSDELLRSQLLANGVEGVVYLSPGEGSAPRRGHGQEAHWSDECLKLTLNSALDGRMLTPVA